MQFKLKNDQCQMLWIKNSFNDFKHRAELAYREKTQCF